MDKNFDLINEKDNLQTIFSKYGALSLEKQENLAKLIGENEPELNIDEGIVSFGDDLKFPIQLIGMLVDGKNWSWAWDNEEIGFPEELIQEAKEVKSFGEKYDIPQFFNSFFEAKFDEAHILAMTVSSLFDDDAYCAVEVDDFAFFVSIKSDKITSTVDINEFAEIFNDFHRKFEVNHKLAFEGYTKLKSFQYKEREDFAVAKIDEGRIIVGFSERGHVNNIKVLEA